MIGSIQMQYEVFIPAPEEDGFDVTLRVQAENWMEALGVGLRRTHQGDGPVRNVLCDIMENDLIHVTDLASQRVFRIWRVPDEELMRGGALPRGERARPALGDRSTRLAATAGPRSFRHPQEFPAIPGAGRDPRSERVDPESRIPTVIVPRLKTGEPLGIVSETGVFRQISSREVARDISVEDSGSSILTESVTPSSERQAAVSIGRDLVVEETTVAESALEEVFLEVSALFERERTLEGAISFGLNLVMKRIPAESGSALFVDRLGNHLYFAAARGPKARELMGRDFLIPIEEGIVGFCTRMGVSLAISEAEQDPRFYATISEELGYPAQSLLCAPLQADGRTYGCIELLNRRDGLPFSGAEMNVLTYVGEQLGRFIRQLLQ